MQEQIALKDTFIQETYAAKTTSLPLGKLEKSQLSTSHLTCIKEVLYIQRTYIPCNVELLGA